jgi:hypothetical protein
MQTQKRPGQPGRFFSRSIVETERSAAAFFMSITGSPHNASQSSLPSRWGMLWFELRAACFRCRRLVINLIDRRHRRHLTGACLRDAPVIAESTAPLWPSKETSERTLVLGKIENLRVARLAFDGIELSRGEVLSFWAQLGRPSRSRGFVIGRELREGCLIPSIGGGLCQLSNALYDAALKAGFEVVERSAHSQIIPGSAAAHNRDATVFWNYVDLRLRAPCDLRLEVGLDASSIMVRVRSADTTTPIHRRAIDVTLESAAGTLPPQGLGDCVTCGQDDCFRNAPTLQDAEGVIAVLSQRPMPEHAQFLQTAFTQAEYIGADASLATRIRKKMLALEHRLKRSPPARRAVAMAALAASQAAARLRPEHLELYVDQAWLPHLWRCGALAGRRYQVLMRALPMTQIHLQLETAAALYPNEPTLRDFRADAELLRAEREALDGAERWISPHAGILRLAGEKAQSLPWQLPAADTANRERRPGPMRVYFPASSLVRKGALELAAALTGLDAEVILPTRDGGEPARWKDATLHRSEHVEDALARCDVVVLPAWVEHDPRVLLAAIARSIPVIATAACGLGDLPGWFEVPAGNVDALRVALMRIRDTIVVNVGHD